MKIALFFEDDMFCRIDDTVENRQLKVLILNIDDDAGSKTEITTEYISNQNINYLSLWLLSSRISRILVSGISGNVRKLFEKMSISIKIVYEQQLNSLLNNDKMKINDLI
ncbi:MAG: hypothetical protein LBT43_00005 [Prevotella sp.]|jgi:hypothetical protein|nr:hypothetical protein [Prevotella sp.]